MAVFTADRAFECDCNENSFIVMHNITCIGLRQMNGSSLCLVLTSKL